MRMGPPKLISIEYEGFIIETFGEVSNNTCWILMPEEKRYCNLPKELNNRIFENIKTAKDAILLHKYGKNKIVKYLFGDEC